MNNELTRQAEPAPVITGTAATIFSPDALDKLLRFAEVMANGRVTVPAHLAGKPADCLAVTMQASQWGMNPFAVAQKTFTINGTLGYEAQLVNAIVTTMAPTRDRLHYEWFGTWDKIIGNFVEKTSPKGNKYIAPAWQMADEAGCGVRVWATMKGEEEPRILELMLSQAQVRNSTLWASDPKQQLAYLAVKRWARLHCPDVILGVYTPDELETVQPVERDITPAPTNDLNALINQSAHSRPEPVIDSPVASETQQVISDHPKEQPVNPAKNKKVKSSPEEERERTPDQLLADFVEAASSTKSVSTLARCYAYASRVLKATPDHLDKATDVFLVRKAELEEEAENLRIRDGQDGGNA
ncbi:RecT family recombinase [Pantoea sp. ME81]|uniref:RecT family recombinase n=1 Tax=Pantoea sp. ME81 TaxID=2743935 RepID=UPI0015F4DFDA|nr:RecT family recombinase [Pantoea sp. ME81]